MEYDVARKYIKYLIKKMKQSDNDAEKLAIYSDIISMEGLIKRCFLARYRAPKIKDRVQHLYQGVLYSNRLDEVKHIVRSNAINSLMANQFVADYSSLGISMTINEAEPVVDDDVYLELMRDFCGSLGPICYGKYNELIEKGFIYSADMELCGGLCLDFINLEMQMVIISQIAQKFYINFAHELGHAIHMNEINKFPARNLELSIFLESLSTMMEIMFLEFLADNGIDTKQNSKIFYLEALSEAVVVQCFTHAVKTEHKVYFNGHDVRVRDFHYNEMKDMIPNGLEEFYRDAFDRPYNLQAFKYFYGTVVANLFLDAFGNTEQAIKELIEFLVKTEKIDVHSALIELGLNEGFPGGLKRRLEKVF